MMPWRSGFVLIQSEPSLAPTMAKHAIIARARLHDSPGGWHIPMTSVITLFLTPLRPIFALTASHLASGRTEHAQCDFGIGASQCRDSGNICPGK